MFRRTLMVFLAVAATSFGGYGMPMAWGVDWQAGSPPTCEIGHGSFVYSGCEIDAEISNWQDTDHWINEEGTQINEGDARGAVTWSVISGPGTVTSSSGSSTTVSAGYPTQDTIITLQAVVDDSNTKGNDSAITVTTQITVKAITVAKLQWLGEDGAYRDVTGTLTVPYGRSITFRAIPDPSGESFPAGKPTWGGTSITGPGLTVTFNILGTQTVTATCGNTVTANVQVVVFAGKLVPDAGFMGRSLTRVGVGEVGALEVALATGTSLNDLRPLTWTRTAGTAISIADLDTDNGTARFLAGETAGSVTFTLTDKNNISVSLDVDVVVPTHVTGKRTHVYDIWLPGEQGAAMDIKMTLHPTDVSFYWVQVQEISGGASNIKDYFEQFTPGRLWHNATGWVRCSLDNTYDDTTSCDGFAAPFGEDGGSFE